MLRMGEEAGAMTEPTGAERPSPMYGEYASAQEQRARIQVPVYETPAPAQPVGAAAKVHPVPDASRVAGALSVNRIVTIALLAYGAFEVVRSVFTFLDPAALYDTLYRMLGVTGTFSASAQPWTTIALVILVGGYLATALLSILAMRRGRRSWWIPLVGAVLTYVVVSVLLVAPIYSDPAFQSYMSSLVQGPQ